MSVVEFRPHTIRYRIKGYTTPTINNNGIMLFNNESGIITKTQGHNNSLGDYVPAPHTFSAPYKCNAVPSNGRAEIKNAEGRKVEYSFIVYASNKLKDFRYGELVRIERHGIVYELTVKGFHRYKGFVKIWV